MLLSEKNCAPIAPGTPPLNEEEVRNRLKEVPRWSAGEGRIVAEIQFKNFTDAMSFVNRVADLAGREDHHPDIHIFYNKVKLELSTHKIGGLSENDFILAAKIERLW